MAAEHEPKVDSKREESSTYYKNEAQSYAAARWVDEVARKLALTIHSFRPLTPDDLIFDFGGGAGLTVEKMFYIHGEDRHPRVGKSAVITDISPEMLTLSRNLSAVRCPEKGVLNIRQPAFEGDSSEILEEFLTALPPWVDVGLCSLVTEYLTEAQIVALAQVLWEKLSVGGVLVFGDWDAHYAYDDATGVHHDKGLPKDQWFRFASIVTETVEKMNERTKLPRKGKFPPKPTHRITTLLTTFDVAFAYEQTVPSGDAVSVLCLRKDPVPFGPKSLGTGHEPIVSMPPTKHQAQFEADRWRAGIATLAITALTIAGILYFRQAKK